MRIDASAEQGIEESGRIGCNLSDTPKRLAIDSMWVSPITLVELYLAGSVGGEERDLIQPVKGHVNVVLAFGQWFSAMR